MKSIIKRRAKSALAILLTLCMVMSVFTIGVASASAATDNSEGVGGYHHYAKRVFFGLPVEWTSDTDHVYLCAYQGGYTYVIQELSYISGNMYGNTNGVDLDHSGWNNESLYIATSKNTLSDGNGKLGTHYTAELTGNTLNNSGNTYLFYTTSTSTTTGNTLASVYTNYDNISYLGDWQKAQTAQARTVAGTSATNSTTGGTTTVSSYVFASGSTFTTSTSACPGAKVTMTASAKSGYTFAGWFSDTSSTTALSTNTTYYYNAGTSTKTVYAKFIKNLTTPELTATNANAGSNATLTVSNHSTISSENSGVTYELYKNGTLLSSGYTYNNGVFTFENATTAISDSYTVKAVSSNTNQYRNSSTSSAATLTVYEPTYCLVGNVDKSTIIKDGSVITPTAPSGSNSYWNTWQDQLIVNETTDKPGVYRITVKINEGSERETANIGLYLKGSGQKAFRLGNTDYNTSGKDLTITDDGIDDRDNLYVNELGSPAGGSIVLKKGQTYTIIIDQTKRYNDSSSYPWGKITITTTDAFVDAFAKMQSFNATTGKYEAITDANATVGTASASPVHGSKTTGFNPTLTATKVNNNYTFQGWYSDAACTHTQRVSTEAAHSLTNVKASAKYYALFKQNEPDKYTVTADSSESGTINITGGVSNDQAYQGATISINASVTDPGKEFSHWVIYANNRDITSTVCANPTQAQTTLTMPGQDIRIVAFFAARTPLNITVSSNNDNLGTASYDDGKIYYVGDEVPIEATNKGGVFSRWVVTGGTVANATSASTKITSTGATVTARAVFDYKTYNLYYNSKLHPMIRQSDGTYVSTMKLGNNVDFTVYDVADKKYAQSEATGNSWYVKNTSAVNVNQWGDYSKYYHTDSLGTNTYFVKFDPAGNSGNGTVQLIASYPSGDIATVYAKDGTIRYKNGNQSSGDLWTKNDRAGGAVTCEKGITTVTQIDSTKVDNPDSSKYPDSDTKRDHLKVYSAPMGSTITIQTEVNSTYADQGFYIGMFVINGWKVNATDIGNRKYTATYTLSADYAITDTSSNTAFEITPVYYNKNFKYVTFYVDAKSVPTRWKGTISTCADYRSTDGQSPTSSHFEGSYPGQPLGREGDLYEIKVAKYYYNEYNSTTKKWKENTNYFPSATITAYNYDVAHHFITVDTHDDLDSATYNHNYQTYDFADFSYLAQIKDIEAIMFRCKYETSKNSWQIYGKGDDKANYDPNNTEPTWYNVSTNDNLNTWQWLTDYYGNPVDAFGNRIVKSGSGDSAVYYTAEDLASLSPTSNEQVRIVSYGNKMSTGTSTVRTKAQWATGWVVYTKGSTSGTKYFKAYGTPADFICTTPGDTSTANVKYYSDGKESDIKGKLTAISYDKERKNKIGQVSDTGERIDGQWYYSAQHDFDSTVQVHITTADGTAVTKTNTSVDADSSAAGTNDGWEGTDSKSVATLDGKTTETYHNVTTEAQLNATVGAGYTFVGWYIYDGTTYTKIHDNFVDQNTTMTMKKNYTIVAVVRAVRSGDLVITHSRYTGPGANDGTGKYYVKASVKHADNSVTEIAEAQNSITVPELQDTDKLTITIRTVCNGADTFYAWYEEALGENYSRTGNYYEICSENVDPIGEKEVSYTFFEADCSTFFNGSTLARKTIDLYSDITHVSAYAKLTYKYYDRFAQNGKGQMVSYVVKDVPLSDTEINNGYIPSDEKIAQYAPKVVDTIYTDTKWSIVGTKVERAASNVTLMATQTAKTCYVQYLPNDVVGNYLLKSTNEETGVQYVTAWNTRIVDFNTWLINDNANLDAPDESDFYVSAPTTYTYEGTTWNFDRFDIYEFDRLTGKIGDVIYSTNDNVFGYRIYADCVIYPVYTKGSVSKELRAKIEPAVLNREVYGDSTSPVDRLYADLIISFINIAAATAAATGDNVPEVIKENDNTEYTIETGVILDKSVNLTDTDYNTIKHDAETGQTDTTSSIIRGYTGFTDKNDVKTFAKTAVADPTTRQVKSGNLTKYVNNNKDLTNKNRLDKVFRYTNSTDAQKRIFAAYSYVLIKKKNGDQVAFAISDVQKFNFCYTGNKPLSTLS